MKPAVQVAPVFAHDTAEAWRRHATLLVFVLSTGALGGALYLQHALDWQPCPLCVLQRLAYMAVALFALMAWCAVQAGSKPLLPSVLKWLTVLAGLAGAGVAGRHVWVKAHPAASCGIDPLETAINAQWWVQQLPWLLKADGLCFTPLPPLLGLQLPVWSLLVLLLMSVLAALQTVGSAKLNSA